MVALINETSIFGLVTSNLSSNVTGSVFLSLLLITILIMLFAFAFKIPVEFTIILIFPLLIAFGAVSGNISALAVGMIYLAVILSKNLFFWR